MYLNVQLLVKRCSKTSFATGKAGDGGNWVWWRWVIADRKLSAFCSEML